MNQSKNYLPWIIAGLLIIDALLGVRFLYARLNSELTRVQPESALSIIVKAAVTKTPPQLSRFDDATRCDWYPEDFFDQKQMIEACEAIRNGDQFKLETLIDDGLDINMEGRYGFTLLFWAFACDDLNLFQELLYHGADPDKQLKRCIDIGIEGHLCINDSVLFSSTSRRKGRFFLAGLKYTKHPNQIDFAGDTLLNRIVGGLNQNSILLRAIIDAGGDVNATSRDGSSPIWTAIGGYDVSIVLQLLNAGADPRKCQGGLAAFKRVLDRRRAGAKEKQDKDSLDKLDAIRTLVEKFSELDDD